MSQKPLVSKVLSQIGPFLSVADLNFFGGLKDVKVMF